MSRQLGFSSVALALSAIAAPTHNTPDPKQKSTSTSWIRCVTDVCGDPDTQILDPLVNSNGSFNRLPENVRSAVERRLDAFLAAGLQNEKARVDQLLTIVRAKKIETPPAESRALLNYIALQDFMGDIYDLNGATLGSKVSTKIPKSIDALPISKTEKLRFTQAGVDLLASGDPDLETVIDAGTTPPDFFIEKHSNGLSAALFGSRLQDEIQRKLEQLKDLPISADRMRERYDVEAYRKAVRGDDLEPGDVVMLAEINSSMSLLLKIAYDPQSFKDFRKWPGFSASEYKARLGVEGHLAEKSQQLADYNNSADYKSKKAELLDAFAATYLSSQDSYDVEKAELLSQRTYTTNVTKLKGVFSDQLIGDLANGGFRHVHLAQTKKQLLDHFLGDFQPAEPINKLDPQRAAFELPLYVRHQESLIPDFRYKLGVDVDSASQTDLFLSAQSLSNPEAAVPTIAHESGHNISRSISAQPLGKADALKYRQIRECLAKKHRGVSPLDQVVTMVDASGNQAELAIHSGRNVEEDWADLISAYKAPRQKNLACDLIPQTGGRYDPQVTFEDPTIAHSTPLFRLLHIETVGRGKLPASCQRSLSEDGVKLDLKSCL